MAELKKAPRVRTVKVKVKRGGKEATVTGPNLDDVLRGIVIQWKNHLDISTNEAAKRLGVTQQTLSSFLNPEQTAGCRLELVSKICAALDLTPASLFSMHTLFKEEYEFRPQEHVQHLRGIIGDEMWEKAWQALTIASAIGMGPSVIEQAYNLAVSLAKAQGQDVGEVLKRSVAS